jgi:hypothetical protein
MLARFAPGVALVTLACYGCAQTLPPARVSIDPMLASSAPTRAVLLLPAQATVTIFRERGPASPAENNDAAAMVRSIVQAAARQGLRERGYAIVGEMAWNGVVRLEDGRLLPVLEPAVAGELIQRVAAGQPPDPAALQRVRASTGADAALVSAAWGEQTTAASTGDKVAAGIFIGLFIVVVAVALIAASRGHHGGTRGGGPHVSGAPVHVARPAGWNAFRAPHRIPIAAPPVTHVHGPSCNLFLDVHDGAWAEPPPAPGEDVPSHLSERATLISLLDGRALWSAEQDGEGSPRDPGFVRAVGQAATASLPHR